MFVAIYLFKHLWFFPRSTNLPFVAKTMNLKLLNILASHILFNVFLKLSIVCWNVHMDQIKLTQTFFNPIEKVINFSTFWKVVFKFTALVLISDDGNLFQVPLGWWNGKKSIDYTSRFTLIDLFVKRQLFVCIFLYLIFYIR
jgi:hypothetical protein